MFIRKRYYNTKRKGRGDPPAGCSYQVIESYRENGKVKQRVICNLGSYSTIESALNYVEKMIDILKEPFNPRYIFYMNRVRVEKRRLKREAKLVKLIERKKVLEDVKIKYEESKKKCVKNH